MTDKRKCTRAQPQNALYTPMRLRWTGTEVTIAHLPPVRTRSTFMTTAAASAVSRATNRYNCASNQRRMPVAVRGVHTTRSNQDVATAATWPQLWQDVRCRT